MYVPDLNGSMPTFTAPRISPSRTLSQWQEILTYALLGMLALLLAVGVRAVYHFLLPQEQWVTLGSITQFPLAQPRPVAIEGGMVWVVNTGQGFIALDSRPNDASRCAVVWEGQAYAEAQWYADPCRGTRYTMFGLYAYSGPPPHRTLNRYPVREEANGELAIQLTAPIPGLLLDEAPAVCAEHRQPKPWHKPWEISALLPSQAWLDACDEAWLQSVAHE